MLHDSTGLLLLLLIDLFLENTFQSGGQSDMTDCMHQVIDMVA